MTLPHGPAPSGRRSGPAGSAPAPSPLAALRAAGRGLVLAVVLFGTLVNLLMLTGPIFMLQVYDRVLASRSEATLIALFGLAAFLHGLMVLLDHSRTRLMARIGARLAERLEPPVFLAVQRRQRLQPGDATAAGATRDLDQLQRWLASPVLMALVDAPWTPLFLLLIWLFHPVLGLVALTGAGALVGLAALNQALVRGRLAAADQSAQTAERLAEAFRAEAGALAALGMQPAACARWRAQRAQAREIGLRGGDRASFFAAAGRGMRLFLQTAMLAAGAWLVLAGELGAGVMIAASIILGRALAPVELAVGQWGGLQAARAAWQRLEGLLAELPAEPRRLRLPRPEGGLEVRDLLVVPPGEGRAVLRDLSFALPPGAVLGVLGRNGAGKTSLARVLVGAWPAAGGAVRLGGLALEAWDPAERGGWIGYLPQRVTLFDGTIADNIARLRAEPDPEAVLAAARLAGAHEMILTLPQGYDTRVEGGDGGLSGGQLQRIGLARALYGDPVLVVLDEPDAHLDPAGQAALATVLRALKACGTTVVAIAHRAATLACCDLVLTIEGGRAEAPAPRDALLAGRGFDAARSPTDPLAARFCGGASGPLSARADAPGAQPVAGAGPAAGGAE